MTVYILGSTGLLGSLLAMNHNAQAVSRAMCDITDPVSVSTFFARNKPDIVINCAGVVPKVAEKVGDMQTFRVNALGPKLLRSACNEYGARLIHISTDCVFTGVWGNYSEDSLPNPPDVYGLSKLLGELYDEPHLTIRTSFIGLPDAGGRGLLDWASRQTTLMGWDQVLWNGLTTNELGSTIFNKVIPSQITGLLHLHGETVSKYDILCQAKEVFGWDVGILKESNIDKLSMKHVGNKTLASKYPEFQTKKSLRQQLEEMRDQNGCSVP